MAIEFQRWYGSPSWTITTGTGGGPALVTNTWYPAVIGGIFGTDYGWVPWAPIAVLALAAIGCLLLEAPRWTLYALLIAGVYQAELALSGIRRPVSCSRALRDRLHPAPRPCPHGRARTRSRDLARVRPADAGDSFAISWQAAGHPEYNLLNTGAVGLPMAAHITSAFPDVENPDSPSAFASSVGHLAGNVGPPRARRQGAAGGARRQGGLPHRRPARAARGGRLHGPLPGTSDRRNRHREARRTADLVDHQHEHARVGGAYGEDAAAGEDEEDRAPVHDHRRGADRDAWRT